MSKRDYYEVLNVARNASEAEIKQCYRRLAMKLHPDRNPGDQVAEEQFKEVKEAYEILSDSRKRAAYDQFGHAAVDGSAGGGFGGFGEAADLGDLFGGVFRDIFGGARGGGSQGHRGADLRYALELTLEEAVFGTTAKIRVPTLVSCATCAGSGAKPGTKPTTCPTCRGVGQVRMQQGFFSIQQTCPRCQGRGTIIPEPCETCHGDGRVEEQKTLSVKVPAGVDNDDRIRLAGEGEIGEHGGPPGDLYVQIRVKPHPIFTREDNDLDCDVPISFTTAALGGEIEIPGLDGTKHVIKVPEGIQSGKQLRQRGAGMPVLQGRGRGDMVIQIDVETPTRLSKEQREILAQFRETETGDECPQSQGFFGKLREIWDELT